MQYAIRNSIILIGLLLLVILGFLFGNSKTVKKRDSIKNTYEQNIQQLENLKSTHPDIQDRDLVVKSLKGMEKTIQEESKIINKDNNPTTTYDYLLDICENFCPELEFDFLYNTTLKVESTYFNVYTIIGTASIQTLYTFIYQIENQYLLYIIDSIKLTENVGEEKSIPTGLIDFTIVLNAYYELDAPEFPEIQFRKLKYKNIAYNPFYPRIHGLIPNEKESQFVDTYTSSMIGLTPDKIFLRNVYGRIHVLSPGDKVAYGYLESINWDEQYAVFKLNEVGVLKEKIIYLYSKE
ncbi:MAG: hypothetical protein K8R49_02090 [Candidatus Cloacimonetes bacterium]|nr:hypothetical protein [Candidatus Cloacimonadota bacterium]